MQDNNVVYVKEQILIFCAALSIFWPREASRDVRSWKVKMILKSERAADKFVEIKTSSDGYRTQTLNYRLIEMIKWIFFYYCQYV